MNGVIKDVEYMSRGELNQYLVGTGHELFNPSSGVIRNGVKYEADSEFDYTKSSDSTKKITMDEVVEFRNKELDMSIEDLASYKYTVQEVGKKYFLYAPIEGYKDTSMCFFFRLETDGTISMDCPYILYHTNNDSCYAGYKFSILDVDYDKELPSGNYIIEVEVDGENKLVKDLHFTIE